MTSFLVYSVLEFQKGLQTVLRMDELENGQSLLNPAQEKGVSEQRLETRRRKVLVTIVTIFR